MSNIKFSVLMSIYKNDKPEFVKLAIDSILNQTLRPNQYVIMVDGPICDELKELLLAYEKNEKIIDLHFREKNLGLGLTLNEGLNYCNYDYVARMDADDYSLPTRFEKQINYLENNRNISVVGSVIKEFSKDIDDANLLRKVPEHHDEIIKVAKKRNPFNHPSVIFKKKDVINVGSYKNVRNLQDYFLWVDLIINGYKGYNIQEPLVYMRADENLFKRRSGKKYVKIQVDLLKYMKNKRFINSIEYIKAKIIRTCSGYAPNWLRQFMFKKFLRKGV